MRTVIRPWQKSDLPSIRRIIWESWISTYSSFIPEIDLRSHFETHYRETSLLRLFDDPFTQGLVAEADDRIAGFARLYFNRDENHLYVSSLYLLPQFQGQEIGRALLKAAERHAAEKGLDEIWIGVMVKNRPGLLFYRKAGFVFVQEGPFTMGKTTVSHLIGYKKLGRSILINQKVYSTFDGGEGLSGLCLKLLAEQKETWSDLRRGCESLKEVRERDLSCAGFCVRLQYNPGRIKSSTATVSGKDMNERRCFLCLDHLPEGQKGILYRGDYLILCNPMPVFPFHFTISHLDHRAQAIAEPVDLFLRLMADFGPGWILLYNGPKCGASAPDHLHFQAAPSGEMPIEKQVREEKRLSMLRKVDHALCYRVKDLGREVIILEGDEATVVERAFRDFLNALKKVLLTDEEPMINIAGLYEERRWRLLIFPRRKHRPEVFFREGDARILVSPGAIDMGGLLITPLEKDFIRLDAAQVESIYREVSMEEKTVEQVIEAMEELKGN
ncbi:MAG: GNAT family N-acetyltransferase [Syntrophaceae bacterium]|nr:GNAT family N-acetyltransferase [Syntrophaceae bacterium]